MKLVLWQRVLMLGEGWLKCWNGPTAPESRAVVESIVTKFKASPGNMRPGFKKKQKYKNSYRITFL